MWRSAIRRSVAPLARSTISCPSVSHRAGIISPVLQQSSPSFDQPSLLHFDRSLSSDHHSPCSGVSKSDAVTVEVITDDDAAANVDEDLGIATGVELQELLAERQGKKLFDLEPPRGPFGTKESPAIIQSLYDERIVGCSGGVGEDEHDVVWFKLKKGELYECSVCTQVFQLDVVGPGGPPGGHHHH